MILWLLSIFFGVVVNRIVFVIFFLSIFLIINTPHDEGSRLEKMGIILA